MALNGRSDSAVAKNSEFSINRGAVSIIQL